jgi:hypothetical protein
MSTTSTFTSFTTSIPSERTGTSASKLRNTRKKRWPAPPCRSTSLSSAGLLSSDRAKISKWKRKTSLSFFNALLESSVFSSNRASKRSPMKIFVNQKFTSTFKTVGPSSGAVSLRTTSISVLAYSPSRSALSKTSST